MTAVGWLTPGGDFVVRLASGGLQAVSVAVMAMILTSFAGAGRSLRIFFAAVTPSITGIWISISTIS